MGCGQSHEDAGAKEASKEMDRRLKEEHEQEQGKIKLLLLGAGESGKSTIFKQMKVMYGAPLTESERQHFTEVVMANVIQFMQAMCIHVEKFAKGELPPVLLDSLEMVMGLNDADSDVITPAMAGHIEKLWTSPAFQHVWTQRAKFQIVDSHKDFVEDIARIAAPGYLATQQDVLLTRTRTSGIVVEKYIIDDSPFEMYDVGGQRNERKKWIHCFEGVTAVIFVAALSEYDQVLFEDTQTNRMMEAITLFDDICNNAMFRDSSMLLFLNKRDLFDQKIKVVALDSIEEFSDYDGPPGDEQAGYDYFVQRFKSVSQNPHRQIYTHVTCATDTENIRFVWTSCKDAVLKSNLKDSGFL